MPLSVCNARTGTNPREIADIRVLLAARMTGLARHIEVG
jgi:hypothetical protein